MKRFKRPTVQQQHVWSNIRQDFQGGRDVVSLQSTVQAALPNSALAEAQPAPSHTHSTQSAACQTPAGPPALPVSPANVSQAFISSTHSMASMTKFVYMFGDVRSSLCFQKRTANCSAVPMPSATALDMFMASCNAKCSLLKATLRKAQILCFKQHLRCLGANQLVPCSTLLCA